MRIGRIGHMTALMMATIPEVVVEAMAHDPLSDFELAHAVRPRRRQYLYGKSQAHSRKIRRERKRAVVVRCPGKSILDREHS